MSKPEIHEGWVDDGDYYVTVIHDHAPNANGYFAIPTGSKSVSMNEIVDGYRSKHVRVTVEEIGDGATSCPMGSEREAALMDAYRACGEIAARYIEMYDDRGRASVAAECVNAIHRLLGETCAPSEEKAGSRDR